MSSLSDADAGKVWERMKHEGKTNASLRNFMLNEWPSIKKSESEGDRRKHHESNRQGMDKEDFLETIDRMTKSIKEEGSIVKVPKEVLEKTFTLGTKDHNVSFKKVEMVEKEEKKPTMTYTDFIEMAGKEKYNPKSSNHVGNRICLSWNKNIFTDDDDGNKEKRDKNKPELVESKKVRSISFGDYDDGIQKEEDRIIYDILKTKNRNEDSKDGEISPEQHMKEHLEEQHLEDHLEEYEENADDIGLPFGRMFGKLVLGKAMVKWEDDHSNESPADMKLSILNMAYSVFDAIKKRSHKAKKYKVTKEVMAVVEFFLAVVYLTGERLKAGGTSTMKMKRDPRIVLIGIEGSLERNGGLKSLPAPLGSNKEGKKAHGRLRKGVKDATRKALVKAIISQVADKAHENGYEINEYWLIIAKAAKSVVDDAMSDGKLDMLMDFAGWFTISLIRKADTEYNSPVDLFGPQGALGVARILYHWLTSANGQAGSQRDYPDTSYYKDIAETPLQNESFGIDELPSNNPIASKIGSRHHRSHHHGGHPWEYGRDSHGRFESPHKVENRMRNENRGKDDGSKTVDEYKINEHLKVDIPSRTKDPYSLLMIKNTAVFISRIKSETFDKYTFVLRINNVNETTEKLINKPNKTESEKKLISDMTVKSIKSNLFLLENKETGSAINIEKEHYKLVFKNINDKKEKEYDSYSDDDDDDDDDAKKSKEMIVIPPSNYRKEFVVIKMENGPSKTERALNVYIEK